MRALLLSLSVVVALALPSFGLGVEPSGAARPLKCVYFSPSDCEPCPDRAERLYRVMTCVQDFYRREMDRNGFGPMTFGLETTEPGKLKLYEIKAPDPQATYGRDSHWAVRKIVVEGLKKYGIDAGREVVVIFQQGLRWENGRAIEVASFVGSGSPFNGTAWFYDDPMLDPDKLSSKEPGGSYVGRPCSVGEFNSHYIGGIAHELGHALTLPHDCELNAERPEFGSALMGGGNHTFGRETRGEGKGAFLTFSEATRLSVVPAISGLAPKRLPNDARIDDLDFERTSDTSVRAFGQISAPTPVRALIFYVDPDARAADYDAKTWVVKPDADGKFSVDLTEVVRAPIQLRVTAVRECDAVELLRCNLTPDGSEGEFAPIRSRIAFRKINDAFVAKDVDALKALAETYPTEDSRRDLCLSLVRVLTEKVALQKPSEVDESVRAFDLSNAAFDEVQVGWARLGRNASFDGSALEVKGIGYASGLAAHAQSVLKTTLGRKWKTFTGLFGMPEGSRGSVTFVVKGDGRELLRVDDPNEANGRAFSLDVSDVDVLELIAGDAGDGVTSDHSQWINPILER